jgi:hypothetical protein
MGLPLSAFFLVVNDRIDRRSQSIKAGPETCIGKTTDHGCWYVPIARPDAQWMPVPIVQWMNPTGKQQNR